ncbi:MAG: carbamoyltransferase HypF [Gammaproteobacteria bacterium]|nr:carbamoyltransferase HypF [Gammaproteobacteria bacterium]MCP5137203.1 carbamoyltransferase HypF [Gammaproteobacteria bacterium]
MSANRRRAFHIQGLVQGVGFRPYVWQLAQRHQLHGEVRNDTDGVYLIIQGTPDDMDAFIDSLPAHLPPLARIDRVESLPHTLTTSYTDFRIAESTHTDALRASILPDAALCPACRSDIDTPANRRHNHAFSNCTDCGPRLSIIRALPYDRANTSMSGFAMCPSCAQEYQDPHNRRFHAQANACPECGPTLQWLDADGRSIAADPIMAAQSAIRAGKVIAIKGLGGFHLACDAHNHDAVRALRERKRRDAKPLALMARDIDMVRCHAEIDADELALLQSPAAPIVLLRRRDTSTLADSIAPIGFTLGFMLPYTPLHHLLLRDLDTPLVMTSGNTSEQPQCTENDDAIHTLHGIADHFLTHDRDIVNRVDDSVARVMAGRPRVLRRARGYAPAPIPLPPGFKDSPALIALGADLKSTFCLIHHDQAILSQHIGDLEEVRTAASFGTQIDLYQRLFGHTPQAIAIDAHPRYQASAFGQEWAARSGLELITIQHHHAHIAACLAENAWARDAGPVLGIALDGLGYGDDGSLWGGEFLLADYRQSRRLAHVRPMPLFGATQAMREPWRIAYAHLRETPGWPELWYRYPELNITRLLKSKPLATLEAMLRKGVNVPESSSAGRLFDAVAACLNLHPEQLHYEAQAAMALEALALSTSGPETGYHMDIGHHDGLLVLDPSPMWPTLLGDLADGIAPARVAARFHQGLIESITRLTLQLSAQTGVRHVALSGGVFQNRYLFEGLLDHLHAAGLNTLSHASIPANDGGIALGQAMIASARLR